MNDREILHACVEEMYAIEKGMLIPRPEDIVLKYADSCLNRKQIKHIIEQRKAEGKSPEEIKQILDRVPSVIDHFDFEMLNPNQKYPGSILRVKVFKGAEQGIVAVMDAEINGQRDIITIYSCRPMFAYFLQLKKLHATAAGKTPHS